MNSTLTICKNCNTLNKVNSDKALTKNASCGKCSENLDLHGLVTQVNAEGLRRILAKSTSEVIVDFWASWCGPCKIYGPIFEQASIENPNAVFLKINTEHDPQISSQLGIRGIPTTIVFKNAKEKHRESGVLTQDMIKELLS